MHTYILHMYICIYIYMYMYIYIHAYIIGYVGDRLHSWHYGFMGTSCRNHDDRFPKSGFLVSGHSGIEPF